MTFRKRLKQVWAAAYQENIAALVVALIIGPGCAVSPPTSPTRPNSERGHWIEARFNGSGALAHCLLLSNLSDVEIERDTTGGVWLSAYTPPINAPHGWEVWVRADEADALGFSVATCGWNEERR